MRVDGLAAREALAQRACKRCPASSNAHVRPHAFARARGLRSRNARASFEYWRVASTGAAGGGAGGGRAGNSAGGGAIGLFVRTYIH